MSIIDVTSGTTYATVSAAILGSGNGDVISLSAGAYSEYFPTIRHDLTIQGVGGLAYLTTPGPPDNGKGILVTNGNIVLRNLDLSGARVNDGNGAGVRYESGTLLVVNTRIHDNENGILANAGPGSITIAQSEIDHNGAGDGYTHNLYINEIANLVIRDSYIHDAAVGHEVKSRADNTTITNTRIQDQQGDASYAIDLPNGGAAIITGNTIEKGPNVQNRTVIHLGGDGAYANTSLTATGNTLIDDLPQGASSTLVFNQTTTTATFTANTLYGFANSTIPAGNTVLSRAAAPLLDTSSPVQVPEPGSAAVLLAALCFGLLAVRFAAREPVGRGCGTGSPRRDGPAAPASHSPWRRGPARRFR